MMRYGFLILAGMSLVLTAAAQDASEQTIKRPEQAAAGTNASDRAIMNISAPAETNAFGTSVQVIRTLEESMAETNASRTAATETSTNQVKSTGTAFLMDAGVKYTEEGEYEEAERAYLRVLKSDPENEDIQFRLSTVYILMKRYSEAVQILEKLAKKHPDDAAVRNNLAWTYATGDKVINGKLALRHARESILSSPISPAVWNTLAEAYYSSGKYDEALRSSEHALQLLKVQNPSEKELRSYEMQHGKILRAKEATDLLLGLDDKK